MKMEKMVEDVKREDVERKDHFVTMSLLLENIKNSVMFWPLNLVFSYFYIHWLLLLAFVLPIRDRTSALFFSGINLEGGLWSFSLHYLPRPSFLFKMDKEGDQPASHKLLLLAMVKGMLTGYLFNSPYLSTVQPIAIALLTPLLIAASARYVVPLLIANPARAHLMTTMLGTGVIAHLAIGLVLGLLSLSYLVLTLVYAGVAYCTLQLLFKYNSASDEAKDVGILYMLAYLVAAVYMQGLVFVLFGGAKKLLIE